MNPRNTRKDGKEEAKPTPVPYGALMSKHQNVIMMIEALPSEGAVGGGVPFMLVIKAGVSRPVGFASRKLAERLMPRFGLERKVWLESADLVIHRFPDSFTSGEIVFFGDRQTMDKFVNEPAFLPLMPIAMTGCMDVQSVDTVLPSDWFSHPSLQ
jgi:hypothetical protein